jgi:hypothetical protein
MMAMSKKIQSDAPGEVEALLPWHAAGTLSPRDARRVEDALAQDPELARQYAVIRAEYAETILLNESLGAPSSRAMQKLFAAIDAEPVRAGASSLSLSTRIGGYFARLSPRTLMATAAIAALAIVLQAGIIGVVLTKRDGGFYQAASYGPSNRAGGSQSTASEPSARALVRFKPDARMADIATLLESYQASIVDSTSGGMVQLQFKQAMSRDDVAGVVAKLQNERIVGLAVVSQ